MLYNLITRILLVEYGVIAVISYFVKPTACIYWVGAVILTWGVIVMGGK